jgi:outer membrane protein, heavy metal efflux system
MAMPRYFSPLWWLLPLSALFAPVSLAAQGTSSDTAAVLDLADLLRTLEADNPELTARWIDTEVIGTRRRQVVAWPDPMVMASYQPYPMLTSHGAQRSQWRVEQAVPYPGTLQLQGDIVDLEASIATDETRTLALDLGLDLKRAYFTLYRTQQLIPLLDEFEIRLRAFEGTARSLYEAGGGSQQAILQAQLERASLNTRRYELEHEALAARETLRRLSNRPAAPQGAAVLNPPPPLPPRDSLLALARSLRPEVSAILTAERRSLTSIDLARRSALPELGIVVTYFDIAAAADPPGAMGRDALELGVTATLPIQRGRIRSRLQEAHLALANVQAQAQAVALAIETHLDEALHGIEQHKHQLALLRNALLPQADAARQAALTRYASGQASFLDLLEAERSSFGYRVDYEETYVDYLMAYAVLERVVGTVSLETRAAANRRPPLSDTLP